MIGNIYTLPEINFVGGSSESLVFNAYAGKDKSRPFGLIGCVANFAIVNFVNKNSEPLVSKVMSVTMNEDETDYNVLSVDLDPGDTLDLSGKFVYQVTIKDVDNNVDIPQQGIIYIHNNINKGFLRA